MPGNRGQSCLAQHWSHHNRPSHGAGTTELRPFLRGRERRAPENFSSDWKGAVVLTLCPQQAFFFCIGCGFIWGERSWRERSWSSQFMHVSRETPEGVCHPHSLCMPLAVCPFCMYFEHLLLVLLNLRCEFPGKRQGLPTYVLSAGQASSSMCQ